MDSKKTPMLSAELYRLAAPSLLPTWNEEREPTTNELAPSKAIGPRATQLHTDSATKDGTMVGGTRRGGVPGYYILLVYCTIKILKKKK